MKQAFDENKAHMPEALLCASLQWKNAIERFDSADADELVDMAIFDMEAAKRRFIFLLKRTEGCGR